MQFGALLPVPVSLYGDKTNLISFTAYLQLQ
jgi:hypothetical protein